jgi:hypothetical protein
VRPGAARESEASKQQCARRQKSQAKGTGVIVHDG